MTRGISEKSASLSYKSDIMQVRHSTARGYITSRDASSPYAVYCMDIPHNASWEIK
jgi:hypothetical protein